MAWSTVARSLVRKPSARLTVVIVRWPVSVMALLRWRIAFWGSSCRPYRSCSWAMRCCLRMCHCCRSALMWALCILQWCMCWCGGGRQLLLRMPEVMKHVSQGRGWLVVLSVVNLVETARDGGCAHACELVGGVRLVAPGAVYGPVILGPGLFVVQWGQFQGGW